MKRVGCLLGAAVTAAALPASAVAAPTFTSGPQEGETAASATGSTLFGFDRDGNPAAVVSQCSLDSAAFVDCSSPRLTGPLATGQHTFAIREADAARAPLADTTVTRHWTAVALPDTTLAGTPAPGATTARLDTSFTFTGTNAPTGFECSLDSAAYRSCASPLDAATLAPLSNGAHTLSVRAYTDVPAGRYPDPTPASTSWTVDPDRDGDGVVASHDCNDAAPAVHPGAVDTPGDGIDEDCSGADAVAILPPVVPAPTVATQPAKLTVARAVVRHGRLDLLARLTRRADGGRVGVAFAAAGRTSRSTTIVRGGRVTTLRRLTGAQRHVRSGIVTLTYAGTRELRAASVRLRAAPGHAALAHGAVTLRGGVLSASGTIVRRARGVVHLELSGDAPGGGVATWTATAPIRSGRWAFHGSPPAALRAGGYLTLQFTGDAAHGLRGEQLGLGVGS